MESRQCMKVEEIDKMRNDKTYLKKKYRGISFPTKLLEGDNYILNDYLQQNISKINIQELIGKDLINRKENKEEDEEIIRCMLNELYEILVNPINYYNDLVCGIYMNILYIVPELDCFNWREPENQQDGESFEEYKIRRENMKKDEKRRNEVQSVWMSNDKKIDREFVRKCYPVDIKEKKILDENGKEKYKIVSIPGGCQDFHFTMLSKANICLFEKDERSKSAKRYSFMKAHNIYESLKNSSIENLILMEQSLGYGFTNQMYHYFKDSTLYSEI